MARRRRDRGLPPPAIRSRLLDDGVRAQLVKLTRAGVPVALAVQAVGIGERTFREWMTRGSDEDELMQATGRLTPSSSEVAYHRLYKEVLLARSLAGVNNVAWLQKAAAGGFVTEETTETKRDGTVITTKKIAPPEWRAAVWWLERQQRAHFGKEATQVEMILSGASGAVGSGGSDELDGDAAAELSARLGANVAAATLAALGPADDVIDAEIMGEEG